MGCLQIPQKISVLTLTSLGTLLLAACGSRSDLTRFGPGASSNSTAEALEVDELNADSATRDQGTETGSALRPNPFTGSDPVRSSPRTGGTGGTGGLTLGQEPPSSVMPPGVPRRVRAAGASQEAGGNENAIDCPPETEGVIGVVETIAQAVASESAESQNFVRFIVLPQMRQAYCTGDGPSLDSTTNLTLLNDTPGPVGDRDAMRPQLAATKAINSVSQASQPVPLSRVPNAPWLLRLDLRDYSWHLPLEVEGQQYDNAWEAVSTYSSQALEFEGTKATALAQQMQTHRPFLLAGDFLHTVVQGELYYALTGAPSTLAGLREQLGIAPSESLDTSAWMRSGFSTSGLSKQPRSVARYRGTAAASDLIYWEALSFEPDSLFPSIYEDPLGAQANAHQAVYTLPNGLLAYFSANEHGERTVDTPPSIDIDPAQNNGIVRNSASCYACHNGGLIPFSDTVRTFAEQSGAAAFDANELEAIERIYLPVAEQNRIVEQDTESILVAVLASGVPYGTADPISRVFLQQELGNVTPTSAAGELLVTEQLLEQSASLLPRRLRILSDARSLDRNQFERAFKPALCRLQFLGANPASAELQLADCPQLTE